MQPEPGHAHPTPTHTQDTEDTEDTMADHEHEWYFCLQHHQVEPFDGCKAADRLGPYATREQAANALQEVQSRNDAWDEQDRAEKQWEDGDAEPTRLDGSPA